MLVVQTEELKVHDWKRTILKNFGGMGGYDVIMVNDGSIRVMTYVIQSYHIKGLHGLNFGTQLQCQLQDQFFFLTHLLRLGFC